MSVIESLSFEGWNVRHVIIDGAPWFVARDVAQVLGYADTVNATKQHCRGVANHHPISDTLGRTQQARVINESDVMRLIVSSKLPTAVQFEKWLFETVLPEIRRTGSYGAPKSLEQRSLEILGELSAKVQEQAAQITDLAPRADAWDDLASGDGTYAVGDAAKMLQQAGINTGRDRLFEEMRSLGWIYRQSGRWQARQVFVDQKLLFHKPQSHRHPETGETVLDAPQVRVTMKGIEKLRMLLLPPLTETKAVA